MPGVVGVNNYDGSPIQLGSSDVIISCILENANVEVPLVCPNNLVVGLGAVQDPPIYNLGTGNWEWTYHGNNAIPLTNPNSISSLNVGVKQTIISNKSIGSSPYLVLVILPPSNILFTSPNPVVNMTLLVLTAK